MKLATLVKTIWISVLSLVFQALTPFLDSSFARTHEPVVKTVVIDPGHGGKDPGCSGKHTIEKEIALSISLRLGELIKAAYPEVNVIYTRCTDVFIPLDERANIANKAKADLFISIHCNYIAKRNHAQGSETYVMGIHRAEDNLDVAKRENSAILMEDNYVMKYDGYDPDSPEGHIILSMYQNAHLEQSILFADCIEKQFTHGLARKSRGVKQAGFLVLRNTTMPSVLIETGFLSHDSDEAYLGDIANHGNVAESIFKAFSEYKGHMEGALPSFDEADAESSVSTTVVQAKTETQQKSLVKPVGNTPEPVKEMASPEKAVPTGAEVKHATPAITYFVQLAASRTPLSKDQQQWPSAVTMETRQENGYYKYLAGPFTSVDQATAQQQQLKAGKWKDAFVVAYKNRQRITLAEAAASR